MRGGGRLQRSTTKGPSAGARPGRRRGSPARRLVLLGRLDAAARKCGGEHDAARLRAQAGFVSTPCHFRAYLEVGDRLRNRKVGCARRRRWRHGRAHGRPGTGARTAGPGGVEGAHWMPAASPRVPWSHQARDLAHRWPLRCDDAGLQLTRRPLELWVSSSVRAPSRAAASAAWGRVAADDHDTS